MARLFVPAAAPEVLPQDLVDVIDQTGLRDVGFVPVDGLCPRTKGIDTERVALP